MIAGGTTVGVQGPLGTNIVPLAHPKSSGKSTVITSNTAYLNNNTHETQENDTKSVTSLMY